MLRPLLHLTLDRYYSSLDSALKTLGVLILAQAERLLQAALPLQSWICCRVQVRIDRL